VKLTVTRKSMIDIMAREAGAWKSNVVALTNNLRHAMGIAAQCFERIAPERRALYEFGP
jgi:hypothetical protein